MLFLKRKGLMPTDSKIPAPAQTKDKEKPRDYIVIAGVLGVIFLVWLGWQWLLPLMWKIGLGDSGRLSDRGQFGDSYGGLNALFTGLAFAGVACTIYLQLKDNRVREAERHVQETERALREKDRIIDRFEGRFFKLADVLRSHIQSFLLDDDTSNDRAGKRALALLVDMQAPYRFDFDSTIAAALKRYEKTYGKYQNMLGPYFRILYRIIKYTDESSVDDKEAYTGIIRAELGNAELWLIALNCLTENGANFKPLVIKYHLLKHFSKRGPSWDEVEAEIRRAYPESAFRDAK